MGCDIHCVLEVHEEYGKWVGVHAFPYIPTTAVRAIGGEDKRVYFHWRATDRNYRFFGDLAGVRCEANPNHEAPGKPFGVPNDVSSLAGLLISNWASDGHSHSYLPAKAFARLHMLNNMDETELGEKLAGRLESGKDPVAQYAFELLGISAEELGRYRVVFWFDN